MHVCCVVICKNRKVPGVKSNIQFHRFPQDEERRQQWCAAIRRGGGWKPTVHSRVCSQHFVSGKSNNPLSPDFVPSIFPHTSPREVQKAKYRYGKFRRTTELKWKRYNATAARRSKGTAGGTAGGNSGESQSALQTPHTQAQNSGTNAPSVLPAPSHHAQQTSDPASTAGPRSPAPASCFRVQAAHGAPAVRTPCTNAWCEAALKRTNDECLALRAELYRLRDQVQKMTFTKEAFEGNDEKVRQLTGLASYTSLMFIFDLVLRFMQGNAKEFKLSRFQEFVMTLMYLTLDVPLQFFCHVFRISKTTASRVVSDTLGIMQDALSGFIRWPSSREPGAASSRVTVAIDCFEVPVRARKKSQGKRQRPASVKYLIGTTPEGAVSFVSKGWPGDTSDAELAERCGILEKLAPGDVVVAERTLDIGDVVTMSGALLRTAVPARGTKAPVAAESVIALLRERHAVLQGTIHYCHSHAASPEETTRLDKMVKISCALHNLSLTLQPAGREGGEACTLTRGTQGLLQPAGREGRLEP